MELPAELEASLTGRTFEPISDGESGAAVWRCAMNASPPLYLKTASLAAGLLLDGEAARLRWMKERHMPVPTVRNYCRIGDTEYLLLDEVAGLGASARQWTSALPEVIAAIAD